MLKEIIKGIANGIREALVGVKTKSYANEDSYQKCSPGMPISSNTLSSNGNNGMNFTIYGAIGGKVVEFSTYNPNTDRHNRNLYIVTDKENLGEELGLIITKESLTR
jgi:hypothetical protein